MGLLLLLSLLLVLQVIQTIVAVTVVAKFPWDRGDYKYNLNEEVSLPLAKQSQ